MEPLAGTVAPEPERLLARGVLRLDPSAPDFAGARAVIRLEDVTYADKGAPVLAEQVLENVSHAAGTAEMLPFALHGPRPSAEVRDAALRAHVDVDQDGKISPGDLITRTRYPAPLPGGADTAGEEGEPPALTIEAVLYDR